MAMFMSLCLDKICPVVYSIFIFIYIYYGIVHEVHYSEQEAKSV